MKFELLFQIALSSSVLYIAIEPKLDIILSCTNEGLVISKLSNGEEIKHISFEVPSLQHAKNAKCKNILITLESMQLYVFTTEKVLVFNLIQILEGV